MFQGNHSGVQKLRFRLLWSLSVVLLLLVGCAKGVDTSSTATAPTNNSNNTTQKNLFSRWIDTSGFVAVDLTQAAFGQTKPFSVTTISGQSCGCQVLTQGTQAQGSMQVSSCSGNFSSGTTNCASFDGTATYTLSNSTLTFCDQAFVSAGGSSCLTMQ